MSLFKKKEGRSKLVMKNKTTGRKSNSLIHCIPQFSQVMPSHKMTLARRALLQKIKSKGNEKKAEEIQERKFVSFGEDSRRISTTETHNYATNNLPPPELTIKAIRRNSFGRESKTKEGASESIVPEITIFPKYPRILNELPRTSSIISSNFLASSMNNLIVTKEDFEKLSEKNPFFSDYIYLPKLNFFVHPLVVPHQFPRLNQIIDLDTPNPNNCLITTENTEKE